MIVTCDPGLNGAFFVEDTFFSAISMPTKMIAMRRNMRRVLDEDEVANILRTPYKSHICFVIEKVHGAPRQSAPAAFTFGYGYGVLVTTARLFGYRIVEVPAAKWKRELKVPADKEKARAMASELMPDLAHMWPLKKDDGKAEAALLNLWFKRHGM